VNYKRFNIAGLAVMILILFFSWSRAETLVVGDENTPSINGYFDQIDYQSSQQLYSLTQSDSTNKPKANIDIYRFKGKSTKRGFLYSLILPGAGEFYAGSKIKAVLFVGLEAAFWTGYFTNHKKGKDKEGQYINFADTTWDVYAYSEYLATHYGVPIDSTTIDTINHTFIVIDAPGVYYVGSDTFVMSHSIHPEVGKGLDKNQQYYEEIGKYDQFRFGWVDYDSTLDVSLSRRDFYLNLRHDSNSLLDKANRYVMVSLANHLLSAFDAALAVRHHNRKGEKFSEIDIKLRLAEYNKNEVIPKLTVSTKF
jgi:hypothetical protein